jgi:LPXTG-site transpeptidase (sortase) family protein
MVTGLAAIFSGVALLALSVSILTAGNYQEYSDAKTVTGFGNVLQAVPATVPAPTLEPNVPLASTAPLERILIPRIGVDAPVVVKGVGDDGVMQSPDGPWDVAWYDFSARPGFGSNAVFSGHVDYRDVGPAVFWRLRELEQGDIIRVRLADGAEYGYRVMAKNTFDAATAPVAEIVGPTPQEVITLITCIGTFDQTTRQYDQRLVVRAERTLSAETSSPRR